MDSLCKVVKVFIIQNSIPMKHTLVVYTVVLNNYLHLKEPRDYLLHTAHQTIL